MNPLRSEEDAFKVTIFIAILAAPIAIAAIAFDRNVALGVAAGLAFAGALYWISRRRDRPSERVELTTPVPGRGYGFAVVEAAQARGDFEVLAERGRRALRVHLTQGPERGLAVLRAALERALA